jgi:hypothetical protein
MLNDEDTRDAMTSIGIETRSEGTKSGGTMIGGKTIGVLTTTSMAMSVGTMIGHEIRATTIGHCARATTSVMSGRATTGDAMSIVNRHRASDETVTDDGQKIATTRRLPAHLQEGPLSVDPQRSYPNTTACSRAWTGTTEAQPQRPWHQLALLRTRAWSRAPVTRQQ